MIYRLELSASWADQSNVTAFRERLISAIDALIAQRPPRECILTITNDKDYDLQGTMKIIGKGLQGKAEKPTQDLEQERTK